MPTLYMTIGLPASGKSTWAREKVAASGGRCVRVNKDSLRDMLNAAKFSKEREKHILACRDALIARYLRDGIDVIVDDTNFAPAHRAVLQALAKEHGANLVIEDRFLAVPVHECVRRDAARSSGHVGEYVIRDMWRRYLCRPAPAHDPKLPTVALCDLDGTLALLNGRSPYALKGHINDKVNKPVAATLRALEVSGIISSTIFLSGRDGATRHETLEWLHSHTHWTREALLYMRPSGDTRADYLVKRELYERHILGRYNVWAVFDDRDQVVDLWRSLGLTCFQVADGAF